MPTGGSDGRQKGADGKGPLGLRVFVSPKSMHDCSWTTVMRHTALLKNASNTGVKAVKKMHPKTYLFFLSARSVIY